MSFNTTGLPFGINLTPITTVYTALEPIEINSNVISCPNLTISSNNPSTTYNDYQGYLAGGSGTGNFNVCVGRRSGSALTIGQNNTLLGYVSGYSLTSGNNNIMINCNAVIDTGSDNVILGNNSTSLVSLTNTKVIGNNNLVNHSNCNVIGDAVTTSISNSSYMNNIRQINNINLLSYNTLTNEINYQPISGSSTVLTTTLPYSFLSSDLYKYFVFNSTVSFLTISLPNTTGLPTGAWISICKAGATGSLVIQTFSGVPVIGLPASAYNAGNSIRLILSSDGNWYSG